MDFQPGQIFADKYRIIRLLGQGGMGAVYEGENIRIHRKVAIKMLHAGVAEKKDVVQRFEREAQAAGRIGSAHIVEVLDLGDLHDGSRFMVMEYLDGQPLDQRIRSLGRLSPEEAVPIVTQLLEGLAAAHEAGIIHRDLKPANVFLTTKGGQADFVKILDFGVSKFSVFNNDEMSMTRTGAVVGTPFYMSPEQAKGSKTIDGRSDLYAVGVILYECITGQVPFHAETFNELIFKIVLESPPPAESFVPDLDPAFAAIIRKSMAREVSERFQSAEELKQTLEEFLKVQALGAAGLGPGATAIMAPGAMPPGMFGAPAGGPRPPMGSEPNPTLQLAAGGFPGGATGPMGVPSLQDGGSTPGMASPAAAGHYPEAPIHLPKKSPGPLVAALVGAFVCLAGGGYLAYWSASSRADDGTTAAKGTPDDGDDKADEDDERASAHDDDEGDGDDKAGDDEAGDDKAGDEPSDAEEKAEGAGATGDDAADGGSPSQDEPDDLKNTPPVAAPPPPQAAPVAVQSPPPSRPTSPPGSRPATTTTSKPAKPPPGRTVSTEL